MVNLRADPPQGPAPGILLRLERQPHPDDFERICDEDARHTRQTAGREAPPVRLVLWASDEERAHLLVGEELDGGVREDFEEGGRVAAEEAAGAVLGVDVPHGCHHAEPGAGVLGELGGGGLKEDFHPVEGRDYCFGLWEQCMWLACWWWIESGLWSKKGGGQAYGASCQAAGEPTLPDVVEVLFVPVSLASHCP